jgi:hypothetical protein
MKNRFALFVFVSLSFVTLVVLCALCSGLKLDSAVTPETEESALVADSLFQEKREQIVFILGEDEIEGNPYYQQAINYFRFHPEVQLENLVVHCRSLQEVGVFLASHTPSTWGKVHLVVHGNEWNGLGVPVIPQGPRVTVQTLQQVRELDLMPSLSDQVLDTESEIILHACGTGRNEALMMELGKTFGGRAVVRSSRFFVSYTADAGIPQSTRQYLSEYWFTTYRNGFRPDDETLANRLATENPGQNIGWEDALSRTSPRWPGDTYHYRFGVPVNWTVTFPNEAARPRFANTQERDAWLTTLQELQERIGETGIPFERFTWKCAYTDYTLENGITAPAIQIEGRTSILCVLRAITDEGAVAPLEIEIEDEQFYAAVWPQDNRL